VSPRAAGRSRPPPRSHRPPTDGTSRSPTTTAPCTSPTWTDATPIGSPTARAASGHGRATAGTSPSKRAGLPLPLPRARPRHPTHRRARGQARPLRRPPHPHTNRRSRAGVARALPRLPRGPLRPCRCTRPARSSAAPKRCSRSAPRAPQAPNRAAGRRLAVPARRPHHARAMGTYCIGTRSDRVAPALRRTQELRAGGSRVGGRSVLVGTERLPGARRDDCIARVSASAGVSHRWPTRSEFVRSECSTPGLADARPPKRERTGGTRRDHRGARVRRQQQSRAATEHLRIRES
jgi:hypothetical protein